MSDRLLSKQKARPRRRATGLAGGLAAFALLAAACGGGTGGTGGTGTGTGGTGTGGDGGGAGGGAQGPQTTVEAGSGNRQIPGVTAMNRQCPGGNPGQGTPTIQLGTKDFAEQFLLGQMYQQTLESRGYTVDYQENIGGSETIDDAFQAGEINAYPEYLGEIETSIAPFERAGDSARQTYMRAKQFEQQQRNATLLKQTPYQNTDVLIVKPPFAQQNNLQTVPDLTNVGPNGQGVTLAAQPPFETRFNGLEGLREVYGLTGVEFLGVPVGQTYQALDSGQANVADAFSTDGQLSTGDYTTLKDPENIFGFQHVAPVVKQPLLQQLGPQFRNLMNCVSSRLTVELMRSLNFEIQINGRDPAAVAEAFLSQNGIVQ